jgi:hypothetical protein
LTQEKIFDNIQNMSKYYLKIQEYLLSHSLNDLIKNHGVYHKINDHKFSLNYDQIEAKEEDHIAQECRGLILSHKKDKIDSDMIVGETDVLSYGFKRFFNYGQGAAANVDFNTASFFDKKDGTCIFYYWDSIRNDWCVATRSVSEANLPVDGFAEYTFTTLFKKAIEETTNQSYDDWVINSNLDKNLTYIFELCTPVNRIVVQYNDYKVWLTGLRNKIDGKELDINVCGPKMVPNIPICTSYKLNNVKDMISFVESRNPLEYEGIVVCDSSFRRVKVKNPAYMAYNRIKDSVANSPRALMQIVLNEKLDDLESILSENIISLGIQYKNGIKNIIREFNEQYNSVVEEIKSLGAMSDKVKQKQFALAIQRKNCWLAPAMAIYNGKSIDIKHYFEQQKTVNGEYKPGFLDLLIEKTNDA